jgi:hypothetical protein
MDFLFLSMLHNTIQHASIQLLQLKFCHDIQFVGLSHSRVLYEDCLPNTRILFTPPSGIMTSFTKP